MKCISLHIGCIGVTLAARYLTQLYIIMNQLHDSYL